MTLAAVLRVRQLDALRRVSVDHVKVRGRRVFVDIGRAHAVGDPLAIGRHVNIANAVDAMHVFGLKRPALPVLRESMARGQDSKQCGNDSGPIRARQAVECLHRTSPSNCDRQRRSSFPPPFSAQPATPPPSTTSASPVMNDASSEDRNRTASAISSAVPMRPSGRPAAPAA